MSDTFLRIRGIKFSLFEQIFPQLSEIRIQTQFVIQIDEKMSSYYIDIYGPFLFGISSGNEQLCVFIPHYFIRKIPNSKAIELIPYRTTLTRKYICIFKTEEMKKEILLSFKKANEIIYDFTFGCSEIELECQIVGATKNNKPVSGSMIISKENMIFKINGNIRNTLTIKYDCNLMITTLEKNTFNCSLLTSFNIAGYKNYTVCLMTFDEMMFSLTASNVFLRKLFLPIYSYKKQPIQAHPLPDVHLKMIWNIPINFYSNPMLLKSDVNYNKDYIKIKDDYLLPEKASTKLTIFEDIKKVNRTIIFMDLFKKSKLRLNVRNDATNEKSYEEEKEHINDELKSNVVLFPISLDVSNVDAEESFQIKDDFDLRYFMRNSSDILDMYTETIYGITKTNDLLSSLINDKKQFFYGENILEELENLTNELPDIVDVEDTKFYLVVSFIYSIILYGTDKNNFIKKNIELSYLNNEFKYFPTKQMDLEDSFYLFIMRLIFKKHFASYFNQFLTSYDWINENYTKESFFFFKGFFDSFITALKKLEKHSFIGTVKVPPKYIINYNIIPRRYDILIRETSKQILMRLRGDSKCNDLKELLIDLFSYIFKYLLLEFLPTEQIPNLWSIIKLVINSQTKTDDVIMLKTIASKLEESQEKNELNLFLRLMLKGLENGYSWKWFSYIKKFLFSKNQIDNNNFDEITFLLEKISAFHIIYCYDDNLILK